MIEKLFSRKSEYLIVLIIFSVIPLYFDLSLFDSFILPKKIVFDLLFFLLVIIWGGRMHLERRFLVPKNNYLNLLLVLYVSVEILSVIFSATPEQAWLGSSLRMYGSFLSLQLLVIFYWLIVNYDYVKGKLSWLIGSVSLSGAVAALYGLIQVLGFDPLRWQVFEGTLIRASSTLGQPNYLGSYLLGVLVISILGLYQNIKNNWRWVFLTAVTTNLLALAYTLSRSAWLGLLGAGMIVFLSRMYQRRRRYFWLICGLAAPLLVVWMLLGFSGRISTVGTRHSEFEKRVISLFDFREGSIRGFYYAAAGQLIKERPFFGYGRDSLGYYFYPYYSAKWSIFEVLNQSTDRAHNFWLDQWLELGVLGVVFWLVLIIFIFRKSYKFSYSEPITILSLIGFLAIFISWQFGFMTLEPALLFWLFLAMIIGEMNLTKHEMKVGPLPLLLTGSAVFFFCVFGLLSDFNRYRVSHLYRDVLIGNAQAANVENIDSILKNATLSDLKSFYGAHLYSLIDDKLKIERLDKKELKSMVGRLEELNSKPSNFEYRLNRLVFLTNMSKDVFWRGGGRALAASLEKDFAELEKDAPNYAVLQLNWGNLIFYQKKPAQALVHYKKALDLYPDLSNNLINEEHRGLIEAERSQVLNRIVTCEQELNNEIMKQGKSELKEKK